MNRGHVLSLAVVLAGAAACALYKPSLEASAPLRVIKADASAPFANRRHAIDDWTVRTDGSLLLKTDTGHFYHASLLGNCPWLDFAHDIGFNTEPTGELDKFSTIVVEGHRCQLNGFDEVADPRPPTLTSPH